MTKGTRKVATKKARKRAKFSKKTGIREDARIVSAYEKGMHYDTERALFVPDAASKPVPTNKLRKGLSTAQKQLHEFVADLAHLFSDFSVQQIELSLSFNVEGKFLGIGCGGATCIVVRLAPTD